MICDGLSELIGVACTQMDDVGRVALIETPFRFADGDPLQLFVESDPAGMVRFFDDGSTVWHLLGRGVKLDDSRRTQFLKRIAERHAVTFTDQGEFQAQASRAEAPAAFARFVTALLDVGSWEREHEGADVVTAQLLDEVAAALVRWRPSMLLRRDVVLPGFSKQVHRMDFQWGHEFVLAVVPRPNSVSAALRKLLDVKNQPENQNFTFRVVLDDRQDADAAEREGLLLSTVAQSVTTMRSLMRQAAAHTTH